MPGLYSRQFIQLVWDEIHDELQEENLETVDIDESSAHIIREKEGKRYSSSSSLYPLPNLSQWRSEFEREYEACLSSLSTLEEKERFNGFVLLLIHGVKEDVKRVSNSDYKNNLLMFIEPIQKEIQGNNNHITFLQGIIGEANSKLLLNQTQAELAESIFFWLTNDFFYRSMTETAVCSFLPVMRWLKIGRVNL